MGVIIPQVVTEDRASGAQVIDGSLKFDNDKSQYLTRTPSSAGNRNVWTWSGWVKKTNATEQFTMFSAYGAGSNAGYGMLWFQNNGILYFHNWDGQNNSAQTNATFRDTGWYHIVAQHDESASSKMRFYVNGIEQSLAYNLTTSTGINDAIEHRIGMEVYLNRKLYDGSMTQVYFIDGQALDASYFGYTDPLTNTWRPKKYKPTATAPNSPNTVWSSGAGSNFEAARPASVGFDGNPETFTRTDNANVTATVTLPVSVPFTTLQVRGARDNGNGTISINGVDVSSQFPSATTNLSTVTITGVTSPLTSISLGGISGAAQPRFSQIIVDGVTLVDAQGWGINGFYLPMDGNSPIGEDKSGRGNNWTPVNFGGSNTIEKATGALPILNTDGGGKTARPGTRTDAYASNLVLALPLVGSSADVSNKINSGSTTKTVTVTNAVASSAVSNFYGGSYYFDGTGDYINVSSSSDFTFGTGDFTIEGWIYPTNANTFDKAIFSTNWGANGAILITYDHGTNKGFDLYDRTFSPGTPILSTPGVFEPNKWYHIAVVRNSGTTKIYIDGSEHASGSHTTDLTRDVFVVGAVYTTGAETWTGYMSDIRVYKGVAKYTSNFIPASTNPDILPDTPSGVSGGSKLTKVTDGAVYFDGTNDNLTISAHSDLDLSSGDFTVEGFVYPTRIQEQAFVNNWNAQSTGQFQVQMSSSGFLQASWAPYSTAVYAVTGSTPIRVNAWSHFAYTRSGSTFELFLDGISQGTQTSSNNASVNSDFILGENGATLTRDLQGYLSNVRVLKGTALYTSDFTPPTSPLTNVTNTKLLCCQSNTSPILSAVAPDSSQTITANGNVSAATDNPFSSVTDGSASFDGSGDDLKISHNADFNLGNGDFTIEFYIKSTQTHGSYYTAISKWETSNLSWMVRYSSTDIGTGWSFFWSTNGSGYSTVFGQAINDGSWHHVAVTRSGTTIRTFTDGVLNNSTTTSDTFYGGSAEVAIGSDRDGNYFNGLISNLRVIKGRALYTSNFTAPTSTLVAVPDTVLLTCTSRTTVTDNEKYATVRNGNVAATNFNPFTTDINAVRGQESGYVTLNPLRRFTHNCTLSDGNLRATGSAESFPGAAANIELSSGKWYYEYTVVTKNNNPIVGLCQNNYVSGGTGRIMYRSDGMYITAAGNEPAPTGLQTWTAGDTIGVAFDLDDSSGYIRFYKNGVLQPNDSGLNSIKSDLNLSTVGPILPYIQMYTGDVCDVNFGQKPFKFPPPDGFQPLNGTNLRPSTVIARPDKYISATLYTGTGNTGNSVSGIGFKPDIVWVKRTTSSNWNFWFDSQRGALRWFTTNERNDEYTNTDSLTSFDSDGFTVGQDPHADTSTGWNISGQQHIAWCWKAGGGKVGGGGFFKDDVEYASAAAAGLTAGNVTPTSCSIGTDPGLSIIRYTATNSNSALIPHGLGRVPKFLITKKITPDDEWIIHHTDGMSNQQQLYFNTGTAVQSNASIYHSEPTADTFAMGTWAGTNNMITYAFCEVPGFSKFGIYEGTNNPSNGAFVELGFRPAVVIIKNLDETWYWTIFDSTRDTYNGGGTSMMNFTTASSQAVNSTYNVIDFLSNGFKIRGGATNSEPTNNAVTYIYAAWAEAPSFNLFGAQSNAR